jgi:hypothetical protein
VCACLHVRACMWVHGRVGVCMSIRAYILANPVRNACPPYCDVICGPSVSQHFFRHYLINTAIFGRKLLNTKCVFWFSLQVCLKYFSFQKEFIEISSKISKRLHVKYALFLSDFNKIWIFLTYFRKKSQISSFIKLCCSIRTNGWTWC